MILKSGRPSNLKEAQTSKLYDASTMNMTLNVPKDFHKQLKLAALEEETTIKDIVIKAVRKYLEKS